MGLKSLLSKDSDSTVEHPPPPQYSATDTKESLPAQPLVNPNHTFDFLAASPADRNVRPTAANLKPITFHVYKEGSFFGRDDIITGPDKQQMQYYLRFPDNWPSGRWNLSLRRGGAEGPEVCQIIKGGSWSNSFKLIWDGGAVTPVQQLGSFRMRYEFRASQEVYCWKSDSWVTSDYHFSLHKSSELELPREQRTLIAHWRTSNGFSKDGCLEIHPEYSHEVELILATALAVQGMIRL
ncbi:hypothetical protein BMF94_3875 [Rhodotorula taiwanensis]|uniref:Uncharacterized protein n=1 Tax=Rhodotorula taiwanensis TaxID=741276 RepID=A0A2S5B8E9_9BASI|nr:hypothetical protein BMF94_3875 [Rhodotorula taiwanensis]